MICVSSYDKLLGRPDYRLQPKWNRNEIICVESAEPRRAAVCKEMSNLVSIIGDKTQDSAMDHWVHLRCCLASASLTNCCLNNVAQQIKYAFSITAFTTMYQLLWCKEILLKWTVSIDKACVIGDLSYEVYLVYQTFRIFAAELCDTVSQVTQPFLRFACEDKKGNEKGTGKVSHAHVYYKCAFCSYVCKIFNHYGIKKD